MSPAETHAFAEALALFAILFALALFRAWKMYTKYSGTTLANETTTGQDLGMVEVRHLS